METGQTNQKKTINDLKKQVEELAAIIKTKLEGFDENFLKDLEQELSQLKQDFQLFRVEYQNSMKFLQEALLRKADKDELHQLEIKLIEKLNELMAKLMGSFADKKETSKRLNHLEKSVSYKIRSSLFEQCLVQIIDEEHSRVDNGLEEQSQTD